MIGKPKRTVALDIGASSIKAVEVEARGREPHLVNCGLVELDPDAIVDGEIMDRSLVVAAITKLLSDCHIQRRRVVSGVCGRGVMVKKIAMERMSDDEAAEAIYWEAEQHVPYDVNDVVLDFKILDTDLGPSQMQVLLVAAKRNVVMNHAEILREAGLIPEAVDVHSFAVQNVAEAGAGLPENEVVALLNAGAEITNVSIVRDGTPLYTQDVSTGANRLIQGIQRAFHVGREEAASSLEQPGGLDVAALLDDFCRELSAALDKSVSFLRSAGDAQSLDRVMISGGCTRIPGFVERMRAAQPVPVEIIDPLQRLRVASGALPAGTTPEIGPQLAVAVGLALGRGRAA